MLQRLKKYLRVLFQIGLIGGIKNLLLQSLVSIESALNRKESRGAHSRVDYKKRNDKNWLKHTMAWGNNKNKPKIRYRPVNLKTNSKEIKTIEPKVRVY